MSNALEVVDVADVIRTPASLGNYLAPREWGPGESYQLDPWLHLAQREILRGFLDKSTESFVMLNCPPQIGKSSFSGEFLPFWILGHFPETRIIFIAYSDDFAATRGAKVRDFVKTYGMELFGIQVDPDSSAKGEWKLLNHRGGMLSAGIEGAVNGKPGDVVVVDDVIKDAAQASSAADKKKHWDIYEGTIHSRLQPGGLMLITATRWVEDDISGRVQAKMREPGYDGDPWKVISIPAIAEPDEDDDITEDWSDILGRKHGDPLQCRFTKPGEERRDNHWYKKQRALDPFTFSCTPAETPIVMWDRTTKLISEVRVGDEVLGFNLHGSPGGRSCTEKAVVEVVGSQVQQVNTLVMESGETVRCTPDHRWFTGRSDRHVIYAWKDGVTTSRRKVYAPAKLGSLLRRFDPVIPPLTPERQRDLDYIAGIIDGEGHIGVNTLSIAQSWRKNPDVHDSILKCLNRLGWDYTTQEVPERGVAHWYVLNQKAVYAELLRRTEIGKRPRILNQLRTRRNMPTINTDRVVGIIEGTEEPVYALQTTTGNYIAGGYASANCVFQQQPTVRRGGMFPRDNWRWYNPANLPEMDALVRVWDLAATEGGGDWTVGLKVGKAAAGHDLIPEGDFVHIDCQRFRRNAADVQAAVVAVARADGWSVPIMIERERSGSGTAVLDFYQKALPFCSLEAAKADGKKENRAVPYSAMQNLRRVWLPTYADLTDPELTTFDYIKDAPEWVMVLVNEHRAFMGDGRTGRHDDTVDCGAYAILNMLDAGPFEVHDSIYDTDMSRVNELGAAAGSPRW